MANYETFFAEPLKLPPPPQGAIANGTIVGYDIGFTLDRDNFAVIVHRTVSGRVLSVTFERFCDMMRIDNLRNNAAWINAVTSEGGNVFATVVAVFNRRVDALKYASDVRNALKPVTMRTAYHNMKKVRRVDTGEVYNSAREAAHKNGITPGAMSSHLNKRKNYEKVHGLVFERIVEEPRMYYAAPVQPQQPPRLEQLTNGAWLEDIGSAGVRIVTAEGSILPFDTRQQAMEHWQVFGA